MKEFYEKDLGKPWPFARVVETVEFYAGCELAGPVPETHKDVYILLAKELNRVKICIADNSEERVKEIQAMSPADLDLIYVFQTEGFQLENYLHRKFKHLRLNGEWFQWTPEIAETLESLSNQESEAFLDLQKKQTAANELKATNEANNF